MANGLPPGVEGFPITDRQQWLQWRLSDITASDIGALFGANPYRTILRIWAEKSGIISSAAEDNAILRRGRWGESAVLAMLEDERSTWQIRRAKIYLRDAAVRMGCTPDAAAIDPEREGIGVVQCKTVNRWVYERDWIDGAPPLAYQLQCLCEMMLAGASWGVVASLILESFGGWTPHIFMMNRHEAAEARIRSAVVRFWTDFDAGLMPRVNLAQDGETVGLIFPKAEIKTPPLDLTGDNVLPDALAERDKLKEEIKVKTERVDEIETSLKSKMGPYETALLNGWRATWKNEIVHGYVVEEKTRRVLRVRELAET